MNKYDLSILIPSRNEKFLSKTIEDILQNIEGNTEIIVGLDGEWSDPVIEDNPRVTIIHRSESVGQRGMTNDCARLSKAKYVMKLDAHCSFDKGFDVKLISEMKDNWTMVPVMRNLHVFDWVCPEGHRRYQGPSGTCNVCGKETNHEVVWIAKTNPQSRSYRFDSSPHFQYFKEYTRRPEYIKDFETGITETMSLQGSCFIITRDKYWELDICDESLGSWGNQGIEVAVKTWLSGGRVVCNHKTWYAHMFRTQGKDFDHPWQFSNPDIVKTKNNVRELFWEGKWGKAIHPLSWLIEKFMPVPGWDEKLINQLKEQENAKGKI